MNLSLLQGDQSMSNSEKIQELSYKSTRETANILQVSLGTIQKMVETGELIAWKTRGGHRRILDLSIDQQLAKRKELLKHFCSKNFSILGIFKDSSDALPFNEHCLQFESKIQINAFFDMSEALMAAVELKPEIIYLDQQLNSIDQYHLIHHLNKNVITCHIPVLIHQNTYEQLTIQTIEPASVNQGSSVNSPTYPHQHLFYYTDRLETLENIIKSALLNKLL
jgi:hypothetical protein